MVLGEVAVFADAVSVLWSVKVRTSVGWLFAPIGVIAVLAHALGIENAVNVSALGNLAARDTLIGLFWLLGLTRLPDLTGVENGGCLGASLVYSWRLGWQKFRRRLPRLSTST